MSTEPVVQYCEAVACTVCDRTAAETEIKKFPLMTGIPFSAPHSEQIHICKDCSLAWMENGGTTRAEIRKTRGLDSEPNS